MHFTVLFLALLWSTVAANPFKGKRLFVDPSYIAQIKRALKTTKNGDDRKLLRTLQSISTAFWVVDTDHIFKKPGVNRVHFHGALASAAAERRKNRTVPMVSTVVYNLPNRDCSAYSSSGRICCETKPGSKSCNYLAGGVCEKGLRQYQRRFIDKMARSTKRFCGVVPMAFVIEPDALPNMVTNLGDPRCGSSSTRAATIKGVQYAVKTLHKACPKAALYLHAASGNWLGWYDNASGFASLVKSLGLLRYIRGFAVNVANYQPVGKACPRIRGLCAPGAHVHPCCRLDPCGLARQYNDGFNEANYIEVLREEFARLDRSFNPRFIVDTSRNGVPGAGRTDCGNWCNVRRAGIGLRPTTNTGNRHVDAFLWIKPPGESDGCTRILPNGKRCPRFDPGCESTDSLGGRPWERRAPEAGLLMKDHLLRMLRKGK